jgi:hypothetical protein
MAKLRLNGATITLDGCGRCSTCASIKPEAEFYKDRSRSSGISSRCISCETARTQTRTQKHSLMNELKDLAAKHPFYRDVLHGATARLAA